MKRQGFTLVEVLVTLLIMGWVLVSMAQILTVSRKSRDEIHNTQERMLAGPAILHRIESDLRGIVTYNRDIREALRIQDRTISGYDADRMDFVTSTNGLLPFRERSNERFRRADVNEVGFVLRRRPGSDDFLELYRRETFGVDDEPLEGGKYALLHDRVKAFDIRIYDEDGPEADPLDEWGTGEDENVGLPNRIEISLAIEMAPRLVREQVVVDRRTITYRRIIRFPEIQRLALANPPMPVVPTLTPPTGDPTASGAGPMGGQLDPTGGDNRPGGGAGGGVRPPDFGSGGGGGGGGGGGANPFGGG